MYKIILILIVIVSSVISSNAYTLITTTGGTIYRGVITSDSNKTIIMKKLDGKILILPLDSIAEVKKIRLELKTVSERNYTGYIDNFDSAYVFFTVVDSSKLKIPYDQILSFNNTFADTLLKLYTQEGLRSDIESMNNNSNQIGMIGLTGLSPGTFNAMIGYTLYFIHIRVSVGLLSVDNYRGFQVSLGLCFYKNKNSSYYFNYGTGNVNILPMANLSGYYGKKPFQSITYSMVYRGLFAELGLCYLPNNSRIVTPMIQLGFVYELK